MEKFLCSILERNRMKKNNNKKKTKQKNKYWKSMEKTIIDDLISSFMPADNAREGSCGHYP